MSYELVLVDPLFFIEKGMSETCGPWQHTCPSLLGAGIPCGNSCACGKGFFQGNGEVQESQDLQFPTIVLLWPENALFPPPSRSHAEILSPKVKVQSDALAVLSLLSHPFGSITQPANQQREPWLEVGPTHSCPWLFISLPVHSATFCSRFVPSEHGFQEFCLSIQEARVSPARSLIPL